MDHFLSQGKMELPPGNQMDTKSFLKVIKQEPFDNIVENGVFDYSNQIQSFDQIDFSENDHFDQGYRNR
jgi:hypothetical protein